MIGFFISLDLLPKVFYNTYCSGCLSDLEPTFSIPNKVLKRVSADDTHPKAGLGKVGRSQGFFYGFKEGPGVIATMSVKLRLGIVNTEFGIS